MAYLTTAEHDAARTKGDHILENRKRPHVPPPVKRSKQMQTQTQKRV
jgi:hypothetical protein